LATNPTHPTSATIPAPDADDVAARRRECETALAAAYEAGRKADGELAVSLDAYADRAVRLAIRRLRAQSMDPTPRRVAEAIDCAAGADLHLATACEIGTARAWEVLVTRYAPRLRGLAARRGEGPQQAESISSDVLADLALPPPRGGARTLLGTYDGAGSLFAWLALILVRRIAATARRRRPDSLDAKDDRGDQRADSVPSGHAADPASALLDREAAGIVTTALDAAWDEMTDRERLALLLRHRDGLNGREMAPLLRVGEPRVSRLVAQAIAKLSAAMKARLSLVPASDGRTSGEGLWAALRDAVASRLAIFPRPAHPPSPDGMHGGRHDGR
jgi:RNA polymerase sigma factor (sigma-70 family)